MMEQKKNQSSPNLNLEKERKETEEKRNEQERYEEERNEQERNEEERNEQKRNKERRSEGGHVFPITAHLIFAITVAAGGAGFQHGYNTGVMNAPQQLLEDFLRLSYLKRYGAIMPETQVGLLISTMVAVFCLGGIIGSMLASYVADYMGRKWGLIWINSLVFLGAILEGCAKTASSYEMFVVGRIIIGMNCGLNASIAPIYLTEISPVNFRGAIGSIYQLIITVTILISQIMGLPVILGTEKFWPLVFALVFIPAVVMVVSLYFCPESPKYLLNNGEDVEAKRALQWFLETENVEAEMLLLKKEIEEARASPTVTLRDMVANKVLRKPLIISVVIMMAQQFSGINAAIYYSTEIFRVSGMTKTNAVYCTMGMGIVNVLTTIAAVMLVERVGRKILFLVGSAGMALVCLILTISMSLKGSGQVAAIISVVAVFCFVIMFAIGPGPIPWFIVSELFTQNSRSLATSIAVSVNWFCNFIVSIGFKPVLDKLNGFSFLIFLVVLFLSSLFIYLKVPETKKKTIEEIQDYFRDENRNTAGLS